MAHLLGGEALHLEYPTHVVFDSVTIGISEGDRIGLVGRNGEGKSSLLRMLAGKIEPHSGRVTRRGDVTVGVLDQSDTLDSDSTVHYTLVGDMEAHEWAGEARIRDVIGGLVADLDWEAQISTLSGGQRRRVALAALLVQDWDVVILDEPTNHLDVEGISWLATHLNNRWSKSSGGLMVVTHDRWFLDEVCTNTWEVHDRLVEPFEGGYAAYVLQRVERDRIAAVTEGKRQNMMKKELAWLRRGAPARTAKPKFRIEAANQLIADVPPVRNPLELKKMATTRLGKDVVDLLDTEVSFGDKRILKPFTWRIAPGERTGLLGANGAGKSTLLGLIAGTVVPTGGTIKRGQTVKLAVLDQQFRELEKIGEDRVREVLAGFRTTFNVDGKDLTPAQLLERLGFSSAHLSTKINELSGGQRRRLQLLMILMNEPNVMILDEPTNDVDTDMLAALEDLLDSWPGTLIVVSHDRYLLERVTDQQYAILDGNFRHVPGGVDEYLKLRSAEGVKGSGNPAAASSNGTSANSKGLSAAELRATQKELNANERKVGQLRDKVEKTHSKMAAHDQSDYEALGKLTARINDLQSQIDELEERWLELTEILS